MQISNKALKAAIVVAALGYFVDVYDLILFSVVRISSLNSFSLSQEEILSKGLYLLNMQMFGMLLGGVLWGILGDKKGRVSVLFGSIFLYSAANIINAFIINIESYAWCRLLAGIGLAGELGAGVTLVAELMPKEKRGYGTTIVATVGVSGAIFAALTSSYFSWRTNYLIGGCLGILLLFLRITVSESGLFGKISSDPVLKGSLLLLFSSYDRIKKFIYCVITGVPIWAGIGILATFAPELSTELGVIGAVSPANTVLYAYSGLFLGDLISGLLSQKFKSRRKVIVLFISGTLIVSALILNLRGLKADNFYLLFLILGFFLGYWAMFVTMAAEQFGTNLRATVATSVPNFVRGAVVPLTSLFHFLIIYAGKVNSAQVVIFLSVALAFLGIINLKESFHNDLDFIEK